MGKHLTLLKRASSVFGWLECGSATGLIGNTPHNCRPFVLAWLFASFRTLMFEVIALVEADVKRINFEVEKVLVCRGLVSKFFLHPVRDLCRDHT